MRLKTKTTPAPMPATADPADDMARMRRALAEIADRSWDMATALDADAALAAAGAGFRRTMPIDSIAMKRAELTERQRQVYDVIRRHVDEHGYSPTSREMGLALGGISVNAVIGHLKSLNKKGLITWNHDISRGIVPK